MKKIGVLPIKSRGRGHTNRHLIDVNKKLFDSEQTFKIENFVSTVRIGPYFPKRCQNLVLICCDIIHCFRYTEKLLKS